MKTATHKTERLLKDLKNEIFFMNNHLEKVRKNQNIWEDRRSYVNSLKEKYKK
ncbi:hypothetical protein [Flexithrix dorotheae]|uniref:hypothetical protein n=1 Tax=Flexithrix dorotheae TaxID=70993 RepID=UPI000362BDFA|nr:hypothetical protein [Flexithrix dorotheae]